MPTVLAYGDSHLTQLDDWYHLPITSDIWFSPTALDKKPLGSTYFCAVPGTRFDTVHRKVCGFDIPDHQVYKADQWFYYTQNIKLKPDYILCSLGGNDCDKFDSDLNRKLFEQDQAARHPCFANIDKINFDKFVYWEKRKKQKHDQMYEVFDRLKSAFPSSKLVYFGLLRRPWWGVGTNKLADNMEWYVHDQLGIKIIHINDYINHLDMMSDDTHLSNRGYRLFMDQVYSRIRNSHLQPIMIAEKAKRREMDRMFKELAQQRREWWRWYNY